MTGDPYQNDQGYQTVSSLLLPRNATRVITNVYPKDPSYPPGMKCKRTGILRSEEIAVRAFFFEDERFINYFQIANEII